jgi:hypothetical protein
VVVDRLELRVSGTTYSGTTLLCMAILGMTLLGIAGRCHSRTAFMMPMASYLSYLHLGVFRFYASGGHTDGDPKE